MTLKSTLFCLFLYVCLVWAGGAYLYSGEKVGQFGFLWTSVGLLVVLGLILLSRLWGWTRALRLRTAARPKPVAKPAQALSEDEVAVAALISNASAALRRRPGAPDGTAAPALSELPLYLLIGPEGSGKSSTFLHAKLEPQLLAGEATGTGGSPATRFCNLWLAREALFLEISGRIFSGDAARWQQILRLLQKKPARSKWQEFWSEPERGFDLRGVVAFCDVKEFTSVSTPQTREREERQARDWQERLGAIAEVFAVDFPLYFLVTKCDALPYFADFFRRLPESEGDQVLGCTLSTAVTPDGAGGTNANGALAKRLAKSFTALYHALADRRLSLLTHEPDPSRRPAIYEFPRELKRIRPGVVQFLSTVFRLHPLRRNAQLCGYYFSGTGELQAPQRPADSAADWSNRSESMEASMLFRGDATQILRPGEPIGTVRPGAAAATSRWLFVSELLEKLVLRNRAKRIAKPVDARVEQNRKLACAAVCACCLLLSVAFITSWTQNLRLLDRITDRSNLAQQRPVPSLDDLKELERLRLQAAQLSDYERNGAPLKLRWGLYSGNRVVAAARVLYFRRFQNSLLAPLNGVIVNRLLSLPATPQAQDPYNPVFRLLQTHLMISSGTCQADPALASEVLKGAAREMAPAMYGSEWRALAFEQIDFYTQELHYGSPCKLAENNVARDRARQYLAQVRGVDRLYANILAAAEKTFATPQRLRDLSAEYGAVLNGSGEVSGVFTRDGWNYIEKASRSSNAGMAAETCVLGDAARSEPGKRDVALERAIQHMFVRDYVERWRRFVEGFSVRGYGSAADAAHKLEVLSDHKSPLLAVFVMASNQTTFVPTVAEPAGFERVEPLVKKILPKVLGGGSKVSASVLPQTGDAQDPLSSATDITRYFQPVHWVEPAGSETWIADKNSAYIEALAQLGHSMQEIARSGSNPEQAAFQAAGQSYDKALDAARQLARGFQPLGVGGLDMTVERLLEAPIRSTQRFIIDVDSATAGKINGELRQLCVRLRSTLHKYPFNPSGEDATLVEIGALFAPGGGAVWKFQADCLGDLTAKEGEHWKVKDPAKKPQVTQEMVTFLNRAQALSDAFYPGGASQPRFTYTLRPKLDASYKDAALELEIDGQSYTWASSLQKQFVWPANGSGKSGVVGRLKMGSLSFPFASRGGNWAMLRVMGDAEPRPLGTKQVEWKYVRGGDGRLEQIQPAPVRLEFVEFPGGVDLFNPKFFEGMQCPGKAVQ